MDVLLEHLRTNAAMYATGVVLALPLIYLTRKYSVPAILYAVEAIIYFALMHCVMFGIVAGFRWFKENSSMRALREDGKPADAPDWGTPFFEFWNAELYRPHWVLYVEIVFAVLILVLMYRYRPMKIQRKSRRKTQEFQNKGKKPEAGNREFDSKRYSASRGKR
ncbi:MAG: hypothetical protein HYV27_21740 [Candidatus Hydrogenedentes bacterium]|nr:hypothetical protein [Candidatus Hydrogenedentota bacterium]